MDPNCLSTFLDSAVAVGKLIDKNKSSILETSHNRDIAHCCKFHCFGSERVVVVFHISLFCSFSFKYCGALVPSQFSRDAACGALQSVDGLLLVAASSPWFTAQLSSYCLLNRTQTKVKHSRMPAALPVKPLLNVLVYAMPSSYRTQYILYVARLGHWLWWIIILLFCGLRSVMGWLVLGYTTMNWGYTGYKVSVQ